MEGARSDEQDVIGLHRAVLGRDGGALDQRQQVALHALARYVAADPAVARGDLVDFVEEHDAVLLDRVDRLLHKLLLIEQLVGFLRDQNFMRLQHCDTAGFGAAAAELAEDVADVYGSHLRTGHAGNFEHRHAAARGGYLDFDLLVVQLAGAKFLAERVFSGRACVRANQRIDDARFGGLLGTDLNVFALSLACQRDADLQKIAHDLLDVAADIADLGELSGFDLDERRAGEPRQPPRDFGFADPGRPDHQDILRQHLFAELFVKLQAPPAVAQRDCHRTFGVTLANDEAVELGNDFAWREVRHRLMNPYVVSQRRLSRSGD